jgi:uncharacterized protein (UPF0332 family)
MTEDNRRKAIAEAVKSGGRALQAARALRDLGLYNDALSRLYYALLHHVTALLLTHGIEPRRHRALPGLVTTHLVPNGPLVSADVTLVARIAGYRDLADYERAWEASRQDADQAFADVEPLVERALKFLQDEGWTR